MCNDLKNIAISDWPKLRDLYKTEWPKYHLEYLTLDNFINRIKREDDIRNFNVYSLNEDWSDGTFIIVHRYLVFFSTVSSNLSRLIDALACLDSSKHYIFYGFMERVRPAVCEYMSRLGLQPKIDVSFLQYMPREEVLQLSIDPPKSYTIRPLKVQDAVFINSVWPHRHNGSEYIVKSMIKRNLNVGVYNGQDELIAWCLRLPIGSLGLLQVKDEYRRQGFGQLVVKALGKLIAESGSDVCAPVVAANTPSRNMFKKIGFKEVDNVYWMEKPATNDEGNWNVGYDSD